MSHWCRGNLGGLALCIICGGWRRTSVAGIQTKDVKEDQGGIKVSLDLMNVMEGALKD